MSVVVEADGSRPALRVAVRHPLGIAALVAAAAFAVVVTAELDAVRDASSTSLAWSDSLGDLRWALVVAGATGLVLSVVHYLLAAVALRAASGQPLPLGETTLAQLAAAVVNRVTPSGL